MSIFSHRCAIVAPPMQERATSQDEGFPRRSLLGLALLMGALLWSFWPTLSVLEQRWSVDPRYSHGFLVPLFSLFLLWFRRGMCPSGLVPAAACWWGVALIAAAAVLRFGGVYAYVEWVEAAALLPFLAGIAVLTVGWLGLRWSFPSIAFLLFMIPLPFRLEVALGAPLQRLAALTSAYLLQTLGQPAFAEENVITVNATQVGVIEACNGLGMMVTFAAIATAAILLRRQALVGKIAILLSVIPISFVANVVRITATALLHETVGKQVAEVVYHDLAGWLMMPLGMALLWLEVRFLSCVFTEDRDESSPLPLGWARVSGSRAPAAAE
jgi:exosortase